MPGGEEGAGFSQKLVLLLQLAHPPTQSSNLSFHLAWIRAALTHSLAPPALECDPPAHHRFTQPSIPSHRRDRKPVSNTKDATSRRYSGVKRRRVPMTGTSLVVGTHTRFTKCQQHQPKPTLKKSTSASLEPNLPKSHIEEFHLGIDQVLGPHSTPRFLEAVVVLLVNIREFAERILVITLLF